MGSIGIPELVLVFVILLLIFGGRKIPELARGLGQGIRQFKDSLQGRDADAPEDPPAETDKKE
jgi:sec-independent protein translocase protein TatA